MSFNDKTTPFDIDDDDIPAFKPKKLTKNDRIYGIFNNESPSDEEKEPKASFGLLPNYTNFKKSDHVLYESSKKIQVKLADKKPNEKPAETSELLQDLKEEFSEKPVKKSEIRAKRVFNFKRKAPLGPEAFDMPEALGARKKPKLESEEIPKKSAFQGSKEAQKLKEQYGKGFLMIKNLGFELGKGLGKEKQGILKPVEAVQKTAYNSNFENRSFSKKDENYEEDLEKEEKLEKNEENREEKNRDDTEKIVRRWKKSSQKTKKTLKIEDLQGEKLILQEKTPLKIIDMRGPSAVFLEDFSRISHEKTANITSLSELRLSLKSEYEGNKHKLHDFLRKMRFEEDNLVANRYEIGLLEQDSKEFLEKKEFFEEILRKILEFDKLNFEEFLQIFEDLSRKHRKKLLEYEIYVYFVKEFSHKASLSISSQSLHSDLQRIFNFFQRIFAILCEIFPKNLIYDPLNPSKEDFLCKTPKKLMKMAFEASIFPIIRSYITNEFSLVKNSEEILEFLHDFQKVLPEEILQEFFDIFIYPKIEEEIHEFEPFKTKNPIHHWFFLWLPWLKPEFFANSTKFLQLKFIKALNSWDLKEQKHEFSLLKPWKTVMPKDLWDSLKKRAILPKLLFAINSTKIQPENQNIEGILQVLPWIDLLEAEEIELLFEGLLKKIMNTLINWLDKTRKNLAEINVWINGWKGLLGTKVFSIGNLADYFLNMKKLIENNENNQ